MAPTTADIGLIKKETINEKIQEYYELLKCDKEQKPKQLNQDLKYCRNEDFCNEDIRLEVPKAGLKVSAVSIFTIFATFLVFLFWVLCFFDCSLR